MDGLKVGQVELLLVHFCLLAGMVGVPEAVAAATSAGQVE
jgi:hypothetical protein